MHCTPPAPSGVSVLSTRRIWVRLHAMPMKFDATLKDLIRSYPTDWLTQLGVTITEPPEVLSADLSTVSAAADTLIRVGGNIVHIDVESGPDNALARRILLYNVLAHHHTGLPVRTIAILLRSNAVRANLSDRLEYEGLSFRFDIVKLWESPVQHDDRGIGVLPLVVLGKPPPGTTREQAFPEQIERIAERIAGEDRETIGKLMTATYLLATMHIEPAMAREVINRVLDMKELPGYKFLLNEGAVEHTRELILKLGRHQLGEPTEKQAAKLQAIQKLDRLDRIVEKIVAAKNWDGLLRVK